MRWICNSSTQDKDLGVVPVKSHCILSIIAASVAEPGQRHGDEKHDDERECSKVEQIK